MVKEGQNELHFEETNNENMTNKIYNFIFFEIKLNEK
jgi:hypothetical protein